MRFFTESSQQLSEVCHLISFSGMRKRTCSEVKQLLPGKWQSQHGNRRLAVTMLTSSSKLACCVHRALVITLCWSKTLLL